LNVFQVSVGFPGADVQVKQKQIISYGPGIHKVNNILLDVPNAILEGVGKGVTILVVPDGVQCTATNPIIRGLSIVGSGKGVGITLQNTWSAHLSDVSVESFSTGIRIELNEKGRKLANKTKRSWPSVLDSGHWGSRVTLSELREVDIIGSGDGLVLMNSLKEGNKGLPGEFFTATTIWGGHFALQGRAVVIGNNVWVTKIIGTYIDIGLGGGIFMEPDASDLSLVGVTLDLSYSARKSGSFKVSAASKKAAKSIVHVATSMQDNEIIVGNKDLIDRLWK